MSSTKGEILIVDDQPNNLRLLSTLLSTQGYSVRKAINGQMALLSVLTAIPDLILLDIRMPDMDGYEVCLELKSNPNTQHIPIIFISALDEVLDKVKAFSIGAVDYITKPFQSAEVLARVENQLNIQRLQKELSQRNGELESLNQDLLRSNRELEQFSYMVSHDLQQPLQSVTGFVRLINFKYQDSLPRDVQEYLKRIENAGNRMQKLIQALLDYARIDQEELSFKAVDCNQVLKQVQENLFQAINERGVELVYQNLPKIIGNEFLLIQLFQNLLSNGIKFIAPETKPRLQILAHPSENYWIFEVKDNGIGIKQENLEQIFDAFRRLHSNVEYSGNGIGLATCKKIVALHGGKIWVESIFGQGTTFYFTLKGI
jgi:light-regulated signal transduction histidine kinase (bacteriophytochrome)